MARYSHLKIFQSVYKFNLIIYNLVGNFDREHKYSIGQKLKDLSFTILDDVIIINNSRDKNDTLFKMRVDLERLRMHLRISHDLKIINIKRFTSINREIEEISKQLEGWIIWSLKK